jgi:hypothetical protein
VDSWTVVCAGCGIQWHRVGAASDFEKQTIESRPCPQCGGYTLTCREPKPQSGPRARRATARGVRASAA